MNSLNNQPETSPLYPTSSTTLPSVDRQIQRILNPSQSTKELLENEFQQKISEIQESLTSRSNFLSLFQQMLEQEISLNTKRNLQSQSDQEIHQENQTLQKSEDEPEETGVLGLCSSIEGENDDFFEPIISYRECSRLDTYRTFTTSHKLTELEPEDINGPAQEYELSLTAENHSHTQIQSCVVQDGSTQTDFPQKMSSINVQCYSKGQNLHKAVNQLKNQVSTFQEQKNKLRYFVGQVFGFLKSFLLDQIFRKGLLSIVQTIEANYEVKYQKKIAEIQQKYARQKSQHLLYKPINTIIQPKSSINNSNLSLGSTISICEPSMSSCEKTKTQKNQTVSQFDNNQLSKPQVSHEELISFRQSFPMAPKIEPKASFSHSNLIQTQPLRSFSPKNSLNQAICQQNNQTVFSSITIKPKPTLIENQASQQVFSIPCKTPKNPVENHPLRQVYLNEKLQAPEMQKPFSKNNPSKNKLFFKTKSLSNNEYQTNLNQTKDFSKKKSSPSSRFKESRQILQDLKKSKFVLHIPLHLPILTYKQNPQNNGEPAFIAYENDEFSYQGYTKRGKFEGNGKLYFKKLNILYEGQFLDHFIHGKGTLTVTITSNQPFNKRQIAIAGTFNMNNLNGYAKMTIFTGNSQNSFDKSRQNSHSSQNKMFHGHITNQIYTNPNHDQIFGLWKNNQLIGIV